MDMKETDLSIHNLTISQCNTTAILNLIRMNPPVDADKVASCLLVTKCTQTTVLNKKIKTTVLI